MRLWPRVVGLILASGLLMPAGAAWASNQRMWSYSAPAPTKKVPPKEWAHDVCTAVTEWQSSIEDADASLESELRAASSPSQAKDALVTFLGSTVQATDSLLGETREAGVPKIRDGEKMARLVKSGFTDVRSLFAGAQDTVSQADASDPAQFQAAASDVETTITEGLEEFQRTFDRAERRYKSARRALNDPACQ